MPYMDTLGGKGLKKQLQEINTFPSIISEILIVFCFYQLEELINSNYLTYNSWIYLNYYNASSKLL